MEYQSHLRPVSRFFWSFVLVVPLLCFADDNGSGGDYTLTRQYGTVLFKVQHQDYNKLVGRFDDFDGSLFFDPEDLSRSRLEASVNMASLAMSDGDLVETLVYSSTWFNSSLYPRASFKTGKVEVTGPDSADFIGEMTFMGISQPWTLHLTFHGGSQQDLGGSTIGVEGHGVFKRSDYGLKQYMNVAADAVEIEVHVRFKKD